MKVGGGLAEKSGFQGFQQERKSLREDGEMKITKSHYMYESSKIKNKSGPWIA